jgi:AcrR family transcriptional regulator
MPKIVDHDSYRREMLQKCFSLFSGKGYSAVTMKEIAAEIGVSTGTLYHYFPTKENMLGQLISWAGEMNTADYVSRTESTKSVSDRYRLMVDFWKENGEFYRNLMQLSIDMKRSAPEGESEKVFSLFSDLYSDVMSERLNIPIHFARSIFIYLMGLVMHSLLMPGFIKYTEEIERFSAAIGSFITGEITSDTNVRLNELLNR